MQFRIDNRDRLVRWALLVWTAIGVAAIIAALLWLLSRIASVLTPFVLAALVVFILRRPVALLAKRGVSRGAAVAIAYLVAALLLTFAGLFVIPPLVSQTAEFVQAFPGYYDSASKLWFNLQREYTTLEIPDWVEGAARSARASLAQQLTAWSSRIAAGVLGVGGRLVGFVINIFLSLTLAFFVLRDLPTLHREVLQLGGENRRDSLMEILTRIRVVIEGWLRGQSLIAMIVGVLTWAGLQVLGVPYALIIGLIAGVTNFIPYVGPVVGGLIAAISAAFVSPQLVLYTIIWIVILQQFESMFLQPRIMSDTVNIHPVFVVFALLVGASTAGLAGMFFAVPIAGVINTLFVYYFEKHTSSELATERGALFRKPGRRECPEPDASGEGDEAECFDPADEPDPSTEETP